MEAIAKSAGSTVLQATDVIMENPMLTGVGLEPKVVGTAFALGANKMSTIIEYRVYVVKNVSTMKAAALKDFSPYVAKVKAQSAGDVNRVLPALKDNATIEDNRKQFNY
jgi:peptidyl-prolyl cis-trans isomerase D